MSGPGRPSDRDALRAFIEGKDDDAIYDAVGGDVEGFLDGVFEGMTAAFTPESAGGEQGVIQWNVGTPRGVLEYQLVIEDGSCRPRRGPAGSPRVTLFALLPDFLRIITGRVDAMEAYFKRALTASGDVFFARKMESWFR